MSYLSLVFLAAAVVYYILGRVQLYRARCQRELAEQLLDEAAKMHDETMRIHNEMFATRGQRYLKKLADLACGVEEDPSV